MEKRILGSGRLEVSAIGFGCMGMSQSFGPIPGTRRLERLEENLGAADVQLSADDLAEIDAAADKITVVGDRYPEAMQQMIDR